MTNITGGFSPQAKYKLTRKGRKLQTYDDQRILLALPKEFPERIWAEIIGKEESDLVALQIREDILEAVMDIAYENYMTRQTTSFVSHCAGKAWLKLIDWGFFRHDPGEDQSAYPPCNIPNRKESWTPDVMPAPSPKDTWCHQPLQILETTPDDEPVIRASSSIELITVEEIPKEFWFPGKISFPADSKEDTEYDDESSTLFISTEENLAAESEVLQKVTDYSNEVSEKHSREEASVSALKLPSPVEAERGAGDSQNKVKVKRGKSYTIGRSKGSVTPKDSRSRVTFISDCRLRNLRLETQYEITSEKMDSESGAPVKRK